MTTPKILTGWDGSDASEHAVRAASELAQMVGGELHLVLVWDLLSQPGQRSNAYHHTDAQADAERAAKRLVPDGVRYVAHEALGVPGEIIPRLADEIGVDWIVVGRSGRGGLLKRVLGSTSLQIVRHAHVPVIVIPIADRSHSVGALDEDHLSG